MMEPNAAFFGIAFTMFSLFNILMFPMYFKTAYNFGLPTIISYTIVVFYIFGIDMREINILNTSDKPIYQQLFEQISSQIPGGELKSDFNLPPIRSAAKELRISVITVKKAWEELERANLSLKGKRSSGNSLPRTSNSTKTLIRQKRNFSDCWTHTMFQTETGQTETGM